MDVKKPCDFLGADPLAAIATRYEWNKQVKPSSLLPSVLFLESTALAARHPLWMKETVSMGSIPDTFISVLTVKTVPTIVY